MGGCGITDRGERLRLTQQDEASSEESYTPTGPGEEVPPPPSEENNRTSELEDEDQYLRTRAAAFTRGLNSRLEDIRWQEDVIAAIYRDAYRPTVLARLSPGEPRDGNAASGNSADNVSQVEYTGPTRNSGLSLSLGCCGVCGTHGEEIGQGEGGERSDLLALAVEGAVPMPDELSANDDDENQDVADTTPPHRGQGELRLRRTAYHRCRPPPRQSRPAEATMTRADPSPPLTRPQPAEEMAWGGEAPEREQGTTPRREAGAVPVLP